MYDYLKLDCPDTYYRYWLENPTLDFPLMVSERTGEILQTPRISKNKNLEFKITPSIITPGLNHCSISGSIHKWHNEGKHNADTFYMHDFVTEVYNLKKQFDINPARTQVKSFEFGVNIDLPPHLTPAAVIDSIIRLNNKKFIRMNVKKVKLGKMIHYDDHDLKIYDKSGQISQHDLFNKKRETPSNILRIEIRVNKMRFLEQKRYQLKEPGKPLLLTQLMKNDFATPLGKILLDMFNETVIYDKIDIRKLTHMQAIRMERYRQPNYWLGLNPKQRYRQNERFLKLEEQCKIGNIKSELSALVEDQIKKLISGKPENGASVHQNFLPCKYHILGTNALLECSVHTSPPIIKKEKGTKKQPTKQKRYCLTCGKEITHQKANSKYCSEKMNGATGKQCRNQANYKHRKNKRQLLIERETKLLNELFIAQPRHGMAQRITINLNTGTVKHPTIDQIVTWPWSQRRQIIKLTISGKSLTKRRAKQYVKHLKETVCQ